MPAVFHTPEPDPASVLGRLQLRARRVPWPIRLLILGPVFVIGIAFAVTDSGPFAFFADLQASILGGEHYPVLSVGLMFIVLLMPAGALVHLLAGLFPKPADPLAQQAAWSPQHGAWPPQQAPYPQQAPHPQHADGDDGQQRQR